MAAWQQQTAAVFVEQADPRSSARRSPAWRAERFNAIPAVWRRIFEHVAAHPEVRAGLQSLRIVDSGHLGHAARPAPRDPGAGAGGDPAGVLRLHRGRRGVPPARRGHGGEARVVRRRRSTPCACGSTRRRASCRCRDRCSSTATSRTPTPPPRSPPPTAGSAPATSRRDDADGFYSIVGRLKQVIRTGGEAVSPVEVEHALADHPGARRRRRRGSARPAVGRDRVCRDRAARPGADAPDLEGLRAHAADRLAKFKLPRRVVVVDVIPRTPATRQVQRTLLVEQITG